MSCSKGERVARQQIEKAGLALVELRVAGSGHLKARVRAADGREELQVFPKTPHGGRRGDLNKMAELGRFARGQSTKCERQSK